MEERSYRSPNPLRIRVITYMYSNQLRVFTEIDDSSIHGGLNSGLDGRVVSSFGPLAVHSPQNEKTTMAHGF